MSGHCNQEVVTSSHATCPLFLLLQLVTSKDFSNLILPVVFVFFCAILILIFLVLL